MTYEFECIVCNEHFDCVQRIDDEHKAFHCGIEARRVWGALNTDRDLTYSFVTENFGEPIQINSHRQYKKLLKEHGLCDCSPKEMRQEAEFRRRVNQEDHSRERRKTAENIVSKNRERIKFRRK